MENLWIIYGKSMDNLWLVYGWSMDMVGGIPIPLNNYESQLGWLFQIYGKLFQTTSQLWNGLKSMGCCRKHLKSLYHLPQTTNSLPNLKLMGWKVVFKTYVGYCKRPIASTSHHISTISLFLSIINGNFRILKWRYVSTIFQAIFCESFVGL